MKMTRFACLACFFVALVSTVGPLKGQIRVRERPYFPDILGYQTLLCDFHIHTVFSDGLVWPSIRSEEAWREGLDVIAITDHIEYLPHKKDVRVDFNRSHAIAKPRGDELDVVVIKGAEITRGMPPGHCNALFLKDVAALDVNDWPDAFEAALGQGAFVFWNHPGWTGQQSDGVARWYDEHTDLVEKGWLHGIEVVNTHEYYPEAHAWCLEKKLTMLSNSDIHNPLNLDYHLHLGDHRPLTLVFAHGKSEASIKDALFARRTVVYSENWLVGEAVYLQPIFTKTVRFNRSHVVLKGTKSQFLQISNQSELDYQLRLKAPLDKLTVPEEIVLYAGKTVLFSIKAKQKDLSGSESIALPYVVDNLKVGPNEGLDIDFEIDVTFEQDE